MHIPLTAAPAAITLPETGPDVTFYATPVTHRDFDVLGLELFRHNIVQITVDHYRATMIDEVFKLFPEAEADEKAILLDEFWQSSDLYNEQVANWQMQEDQRLLDIQEGAPHRKPAPRPINTMGIRLRSSAQLFFEAMREKSDRVRNMSVEMATFEKRQREGIVRMVLTGWDGLDCEFDKANGIVPLDAWTKLKLEVGPAAIAALCTRVMAFGELTETEKGNSDSPLDTQSPPNGSPEPSGASENSGGTSTGSSTSPAPVDASGPTTGSPSNSTTASTGDTASGESIQTVGA